MCGTAARGTEVVVGCGAEPRYSCPQCGPTRKLDGSYHSADEHAETYHVWAPELGPRLGIAAAAPVSRLPSDRMTRPVAPSARVVR